MLGLVWSSAMTLLLANSAVFVADGTTPAGTFACQLLVGDKFDGTTENLVSSSLGEITLDGNGGYAQSLGPGVVVWKNGALHFNGGEMNGAVAALRKDRKGHRYLHIGGSVMNAPEGDPKFGDHVCLEK